jgi:hypothetical protein
MTIPTNAKTRPNGASNDALVLQRRHGWTAPKNPDGEKVSCDEADRGTHNAGDYQQWPCFVHTREYRSPHLSAEGSD